MQEAILLPLTGVRGTDVYRVEPVPSDFGHAYAVIRPDGEVYHVLVDGNRSSCECLGFLRWGHCKHLRGVRSLEETQARAV